MSNYNLIKLITLEILINKMDVFLENVIYILNRRAGLSDVTGNNTYCLMNQLQV